MMIWARVCLAAAVLLGGPMLAGCTPDPQVVFPDERRTGLLIEPLEARKAGYTIKWSRDLQVPADQRITSVTTLDGLLIVIEEPVNMVSAIDRRDGELHWRRVIGSRNERLFTPIREDQRLMITSETRVFQVAADTGAIRTVTDLDEVVVTPPVRAGDLMAFGGADGKVFGYNFRAGFTRWGYLMTARIAAPPVYRDGRVFAADAKGRYVMLGADDGILRWRGRTFGAITASPIFTDTAIYIASEDQSLYTVDTRTGEDLWVYRATRPLSVEPALFDDLLLLPVPGDGLAALDAATGDLRWKAQRETRPVSRIGQTLIMATDRSLEVVDAQSGRVIDQALTGPLQQVVPGPGQSVLLVSPRGAIVRLDPQR